MRMKWENKHMDFFFNAVHSSNCEYRALRGIWARIDNRWKAS